jgi:hypothetical protein
MTSIFNKIRNKSKVKLFSVEDVVSSREITESEFMESYDRSRDGATNDLKWQNTIEKQNTTLSDQFQNTIENIIEGSNWIPLTHNYITDHFPVLAQESDRFQ